MSTCLEMSPQYHSASCRAMLLFIPLLVTDVGLGGLGGSAVKRKERLVENKTAYELAALKVIYIHVQACPNLCILTYWWFQYEIIVQPKNANLCRERKTPKTSFYLSS